MSEEQWTLASVKEYFEALLAEQEKRRDERHVATLLAVEKSEIALEQRLDSVKNEFDALERRYDEQHAALVTDVRLLQARVIPMLWVGSTLVLSVIGVFISHIVTGRP